MGEISADIEPGLRVTLARNAERELARRSVSAALTYFVVTVTLAFGTPFGADHPRLMLAAGATTLTTGLIRLFAGLRLREAETAALARWRWPFRTLIFFIMLYWGLFTTLALHLYAFAWTSMLALFATSALVSGGTSSLAPHPPLARASLCAMVLPPTLWSAWQGGPQGYSLVAFGLLYLAFSIAQVRQNWDAFRATSIAASREATRQANELFRAALEAVETGIGLIAPNGRFLRVNGHLCGLLRVREADLLASRLQDVLPDSSLAEPLAGAAPQEILDVEYEREEPDGSRSWLSLARVAVDTNGQGPGYSVLLARDITSQKQEIADRFRAAARLSQVQRLESVGALAGGVAHDFNNLLAVIIGYADLALTQDLSPAARGGIEEILSASLRAETLTRRLLAFGRRQVLEARPTDVNSRLQDLRGLLSHTLGETIVLDLELGPNTGCALADEAQLEQVFVNVALNARDAMPTGGTLSIKSSAPDDATVRIVFTDTGTGMSEETRRRVFEPFFSTKRLGDGTGLGLASVYGIVTQSGGEIAIESELGRGTTVRITLPRTNAEGDDRPALPSDDQGAPKAARTATILVVEDEVSLRRLIGQILRDSGHTVLSAENGQLALDLAVEFGSEIDLLVTDVILPGIDGKEVAAKLTAAQPSLPVLFITGYSEARTGLEEALAGGARLLRKPFAPGELLAAVTYMLANQTRRASAG